MFFLQGKEINQDFAGLEAYKIWGTYQELTGERSLYILLKSIRRKALDFFFPLSLSLSLWYRSAEEIATMKGNSQSLEGKKKQCFLFSWSWFHYWRNFVMDFRERGSTPVSLCLMLGVLLNDMAPLHWGEPELLVSVSPRPCGYVVNTCI